MDVVIIVQIFDCADNLKSTFMNVHNINKVKEFFRSSYYALFTGKEVRIVAPAMLRGYKWLIHPLGNRAYYKGYYEPELTQFFINYLTKDSVFFDVGSHVGYFSLLASVVASSGEAHSFEPAPNNYQLCNEIRTLNNRANWITNNMAVGDRSTRLRFGKGKTATMGHIQDDGELEVDVVSLDDYVGQKSIKRVDIIKIDVEGFGGNVLRGATNLLSNYRPIIVMEFHSRSDEQEVFKELVIPHYDVFTLDGNRVNDTFEEGYHFVYALSRT